jgi:hypothetical protein
LPLPEIILDPNTIPENSPEDTVVGELSTDVEGATYSYALIPGPGGQDNRRFKIEGDELIAKLPFNYEQRQAYSVRVRATLTEVDDSDAEPPPPTITRILWIEVEDINEKASTFRLTRSFVLDGTASGNLVGRFVAENPEDVYAAFGQSDNPTSYEFVSGIGDTDNGSFTIDGDRLLTDFEADVDTQEFYSIRVKFIDDDSDGLEIERSFSIAIIRLIPSRPVYVESGDHAGKAVMTGGARDFKKTDEEDCCCIPYGLYSCCADESSPPIWTTTAPFKRPGDIPGGNVELSDLEGKVVKNVFIGTAESPEPVCGCYTVKKIINTDHFSRPRANFFYEPDDPEHPSDLDAGPCDECEECPPDACGGNFCLASEPPDISVTVTAVDAECNCRDEEDNLLPIQTGTWSGQMSFSMFGGSVTGYSINLNECGPVVNASFNCSTRTWRIEWFDTDCPGPILRCGFAAWEAEGTPCGQTEAFTRVDGDECITLGTVTVTPQGAEGCSWNGKCLYFPPAADCGGECDEEALGDCPTTAP